MPINHALKKVVSTDIILKLRPINGAPKTTAGNTDRRLFTGENNIHAKLDPQTCLWALEYDHGILPGSFKQRFTSFTRLMTHVRVYFEKRNIEIYEIID